MSNIITIESTTCRRGSSVWSPTWDTSSVFAGTDADTQQQSHGQWKITAPELNGRGIGKITLHVYRRSTYSSSDCELMVGCSSSDATLPADVLTNAVTITLTSGEGWKSVDVSGLAKQIESYTSTWYLVMGNETIGEIAQFDGYGSGRMLYLEIELSGGSKIYLASGGVLKPYKLYRAENGVLVPYSIYRGENGSLVKY